jgi:cell division protease FtsH
MPNEQKPAPPHRLRGFWMVVLVLLAVNFISVLAFRSHGTSRVAVPFSPYFLDQLEKGQVQSITSRSETVRGTFKTAVKYPANHAKAVATPYFSTQVPSFWNTGELTLMLRSEGVQVNARNPNPGTSLVAEVLLGFGPTILLVGLFVLLARRAQAGARGLGGLGNFGRSQARRVDPQQIRVTFDDVAGIDEAKTELTEIVDFLAAATTKADRTSPKEVPTDAKGRPNRRRRASRQD